MSTRNEPHSQDDKHPYFAIVLVMLAGAVLAGMDALGKALMESIPTVQVVWARFLFHTLIVALVFRWQYGWDFIVPKRLGLQTIRGLFLLGITLSMYTAIAVVPLADATAIMFFGPVLTTLLAGWFLGERVTHWLRFAALLGFIGVLLIVRPGFSDLDNHIFFACLAAVSFALYLLMTRLLSGKDSEPTTLFHSTLIGSILLSIAVPFWWQSISAEQWLYLIATGMMGAAGHFLLIKAFHMAPASILSPFLNVQLLAATLYSVLFFRDVLEWTFILGTLIIVGAGLIVWWRSLNKHAH